MADIQTSTPSLSKFNPTVIPFQIGVIKAFDKFDYKLGTHEVLLSGSVGSAKSLLMAHMVVVHCLENPGARVLLGRRALPDLKATIYNKIIEHIEQDLVEGKQYWKNDTSAVIKFDNGSEIISRSWADNRFSKVRSLELSGACIEELTETEEPHFYNEIKMRVGRLPHIKTNFIIAATNPAGPEHWAFKYFIEPVNHPTRHVYYSVTEDNPFLPPWYIEQLKKDLDPKLAQRMLYGKWVEITKEIVYYAYDKEKNFINDDYKVDTRYPIWISWDFNIGEGKPLSLCLSQFIGDTFHFFDEVVIEGMRTADSLDELHDRGLLDYPVTYLLTGDATGKSRDTRSNKSDYDIIKHFFSNRENTKFEMKLFASNPPIRNRHNMVNSYCVNAAGERRLFVYKKAKTVDEGLRLTAMKKGASFIEDDSKHYQHVTTALGYSVHAAKIYTNRSSKGTILL